MTKEEEILKLKEFYTSLPEESYLHQLLAGVPEYCQHEIEIDSCQPVMEYQTMYYEANAKYAAAVKRAEANGQTLEKVESASNRYRDDCYKLSQEIKRLQRCNDEQQDLVVSMQSDIMRLKAKLYDYMTGVI